MDLSKQENQIGCGYCAYEKGCQLKLQDKRNWAREGCPAFLHHAEKGNDPAKYEETAKVSDHINRAVVNMNDRGVKVDKMLTAVEMPKPKDAKIFKHTGSKYHK